MARKPRPNPMEQGSIKEIYKRFLAPMVQNHKPEDVYIMYYLESVFGVKERPIYMYRAKKGFVLPGTYLRAPNEKIQGIGNRKIRKGAILDVRAEEDNFHVQCNGDEVFELTLQEWNWIFSHLETV